MDRWQRRTYYYLLGLVALMFVYAALYRFGKATFEGESITYLRSLQFVVETFTATGYGAESPWSSDPMNVLVILMDLTGVALIFIALPVLIFPLFEEMVSTTVPTAVDDDLAGHVVVATYTARVDTLIDELDARDVEYVLVEPDRGLATDLYEGEYEVIHNDPDSTDGLESANLADARALVADVSDQVDASIVLTAKEVAEEVRVVSVVEEPDRAAYHELAGADAVLSPRPLLGERLADKVTAAVRTDLGETIRVGDDFDIVEIPIGRGSDIAGKTLAESGLGEREGINVVGVWRRGEFESLPTPDTVIHRGTVLLVAGPADRLTGLGALTRSGPHRHPRGETVVVGHGEVGRTVTEQLEEADIPYTVVDHRDLPTADVVGDATGREVLEEAGVRSARSVVLAIPDDTATEFATLVIRDMTDEVEVVARAEATEATGKMYRAGADYVLSLETISGRMIASAVLPDEEVLSLNTRIEVVETLAPGLAGSTLQGADVRSRTGCTVLAVERGDEVITDLGPEFRVEEGDEVVVAGTDENTNRFVELFGGDVG